MRMQLPVLQTWYGKKKLVFCSMRFWNCAIHKSTKELTAIARAPLLLHPSTRRHLVSA